MAVFVFFLVGLLDVLEACTCERDTLRKGCGLKISSLLLLGKYIQKLTIDAIIHGVVKVPYVPQMINHGELINSLSPLESDLSLLFEMQA